MNTIMGVCSECKVVLVLRGSGLCAACRRKKLGNPTRNPSRLPCDDCAQTYMDLGKLVCGRGGKKRNLVMGYCPHKVKQ